MAEVPSLSDDVAAQVLRGFEISLYRWNLVTDELRWSGPDSALLRATGLASLRSGAAFAEIREDGGERGAWAMTAQPGDTARFVFAVPTGVAAVTWIEDQARRCDFDGVPHVAGVLHRISAPRAVRGPAGRPGSEREMRAQLLDFLARAGTGDDRNYVLFGIDNLRDLNRALGPDTTDEIIAEVEARLAAVRPLRSQYGRVGSAKFALAEIGSDAQALATIVRRLMDAVGRREIETSAGPVTVTVSAGICHAPRGTRLPSDPLANALIAYDEARIGRVEGLRFARTGNGPTSLRDRYVSAARIVMDAIAEDRMTVAFQPVVRAADPGTVAFHECLVRILDRDGGIVPAASFMPAIEHLGLIRQVDRAVLRAVLGTLGDHPGQRLAVNISPQSMHDSEWFSIFERGLADLTDAGDRLIIEVTETSAMLDPARTLAFMNRVRGHGCAFALDDFGAGYTSFKHFRDFRFDAVKIDGSFVGGIAANPDNQLLVRTLVSIASHFSMFTVAEFVEQDADADWLRGAGIDCLQGFRFGQPEIAPDWLRLRHMTSRRRA